MLKTTALHATHKSLGAKMVPFGGWDMPVWYSATREEHMAVRERAGLFDVTHMGVLDASGPGAVAFLDRVTTNDVSKLAIGKSQYAYMLNDEGDVLDDVMIYRVEAERYLVVINASNNDADIAWLRAHNSAPDCVLRDLRDASSGADQRVDLALQGPASLHVLSALSDASDATALASLPYAGILRAPLAGIDTYISRTGYTGERIAYELFAHPDQIVALWNKLLDAGQSYGLKPCGLAARDSLRIEAGLPLYGHELNGPLNLAPYHIGFDKFVKTEKAANFIGKAGYIAKAAAAKMRLVRFRMNDKSVRPSKLGDPILDKRGRVTGTVLSCAQETSGYLVGMAMIDGATAPAEGAPLLIVSLPERAPESLKPFAPFGSRALLPDAATVISRFPQKTTDGKTADGRPRTAVGT
jgi:glycine cleavage system T protein